MKNKFIILVSSLLACLLILSGCSSTKNSSSSSSDPNLADKAFKETIDLTGVNKDKKSEFLPYFSSIGRDLRSPALSNKGEIYNDVLYVHKDEKKSLGSQFLHQGGYFYVQEVAAGLSAQGLNVQK